MLKKRIEGFKTVEEIMELLYSERCTRYLNIFLYSTKDIKNQNTLSYTSPHLYYEYPTSQTVQSMLKYKDYQVQFIEPVLFDDELVTVTYRIYIYY